MLVSRSSAFAFHFSRIHYDTMYGDGDVAEAVNSCLCVRTRRANDPRSPNARCLCAWRDDIYECGSDMSVFSLDVGKRPVPGIFLSEFECDASNIRGIHYAAVRRKSG